MKKINNAELNMNWLNKEVSLFGFVANKRKMGKITFIDLRDKTGIVQLVVKDLDFTITKESVIKVEGKVIERKDKNPKIPTGDIEIEVNKIKLLSLANEIPFQVLDDLNAKEDTRLKHRYLDLRRPKMQKIFKLRSEVMHAFRSFLNGEEFLEIETPILSKATPEGARDFLVPTRKKGMFFALPQSPQLYKQLLMVSGFEKYFQLARVFRDEDTRKDRQPEFTQLDIEASFVNEEDIKQMVEKMFKHVFGKVGIDIQLPLKRMDYDVAMDKYGVDKPDLRYGVELIEATNYFKESDFSAFAKAENVKMIYVDEVISSKQAKKLEEVAKKNKASGLIWASYDLEEKKGPGYKFIEKELHKITSDLSIEKGSIFFVAGDYGVTTQALGAVRIELNEMFKYANEDEYNFVWIENWPLFEYNKDEGRYEALHHPFTSPVEADIEIFDKQPEKIRARSYDLVLNGFEIGGGSVRISDLEIQKRMLSFLGLSEESISAQFGFFLEAFKYGIPPHAGIAFGIDRIIMILAKADSIREVIAFPKNSKGISVMEQSPSLSTSEVLKEYGIKVEENNE